MPLYYAALSDRLLVGDGEWTERLAGHNLYCVDADERVPDRVFVGTVDSGLQRTTDGGETWRCVLDEGDRVTSVTVSPHDPDVVWAGTEPSAVYRSADGGESWTRCDGLTELDSATRWSYPPRPDTHHVRWITVAPDDPDQLYVAIEAGAFVRSPDGGDHWVDHPSAARRDNHTLATHPDAPDRVYAAAGDGYALSTDRGETWNYPQDGLDRQYIWSVAVHPDDPDTVVVSAADGSHIAHSTTGESAIYRTSGDEWTTAMDGIPGPDGLARAELRSGDDGFLALTNRGLFRSADGTAWQMVGTWDDAYDQIPNGLTVV